MIGFVQNGMGCWQPPTFASYAYDTHSPPALSAEEWIGAYRSDFAAMEVRLHRLVTGNEMDSKKTQLLSELLPTADPVITQPRIARNSCLHMMSYVSRLLCTTVGLEASREGCSGKNSFRSRTERAH